MDAQPDLHQKVPVLGFGGTGCGLMGAGMLRSYSNERLVCRKFTDLSSFLDVFDNWCSSWPIDRSISL